MPSGVPAGGRGRRRRLGRTPRQNALLVAAGAVAVAIAVVAVLLATHSAGSPTATPGTAASSTLPATTTIPASRVPVTVATSAAPTTAAPTTAAVTTTTTPSTTTTTTATAAAQQALTAIVDKLGPTYSVSPLAASSADPYVAIAHQAALSPGGSAVVVDVYHFVSGTWQPQARVSLGTDGGTGLLLPASQNATPVTLATVTGARLPDFVVTTAAASAQISTIVSVRTGTWRAVPFQTPAGPQIGVPQATVGEATVTAVFNSCTPTCAQGASQSVIFSYRGGSFVPLST